MGTGLVLSVFSSKKYVLGLIAVLLMISDVSGSAEIRQLQYTIGVENVGYAPYYTVEQGRYEGFVRDLLDHFAEQAGITFHYVPFPIRRLHGRFLSGKVDFLYPDNPRWFVDKKQNRRILYSSPVAQIVDGLMVRSDNKGGDIAAIKHLGTISGYSLPAYQSLINSGSIKLSEVNSFEGLLRMVILQRVDAAYVSINPAIFKLEHSMGNTNSLQFDSALPYDLADHMLSTIEHGTVLDQFNRFLLENQDVINRLRKKHEIIDLVAH